MKKLFFSMFVAVVTLTLWRVLIVMLVIRRL